MPFIDTAFAAGRNRVRCCARALSTPPLQMLRKSSHLSRPLGQFGRGDAHEYPGQFISDDDRAVRRLIEQAQIIIKSVRGDVPESFLALMFAGVPAEDVVRYEPRELAELAEAAWQFLQERKAAAPKIRFEFAARPDGRGARPLGLDDRDDQR